jgi:predicted nucleic acid-binding Zn ribbon protein
MPTYLYTHSVPVEEWDGTCCEHAEEFEIDQKITEDALTVCPHCHQPVKRLIAGGVSVRWPSGAPTPTFH